MGGWGGGGLSQQACWSVEERWLVQRTEALWWTLPPRLPNSTGNLPDSGMETASGLIDVGLDQE